jgi:hypothetical protein
MFDSPHDALRHHVTGAIKRGEAEAIIAVEPQPTPEDPTDLLTFGFRVEPSQYKPRRSVLAAPEQTASGNVVLRVGKENNVGRAASMTMGWHQTEHVVLTPAEARDLIRQLQKLTPVGATIEVG